MAILVFYTGLTDSTGLEAIFFVDRTSSNALHIQSRSISGFFAPKCTCLGTCESHTDDSALGFVYVNLLPVFIGSCKISAQSVVFKLLNHRDFFLKAGAAFKLRGENC